jgi:hypothetical protein
LAEVFAKQLSPQLAELYWDALKPLALEQLEAAAKSWIRHGRHFPKPGDLLDRFREMAQAAPQGAPELPSPSEEWVGKVNALFYGYLTKRRAIDGFRGDIDVAERRRACRDLADFYEQMKREDFLDVKTEAELPERFARAMAQIPDRSQDEFWLHAELERQKAEDREKTRRQA